MNFNYLSFKRTCSTALIALAVLFSTAVKAQTWSFRGGHGGTSADKGTAVCMDASGNAYVTGNYFNAAVAFGSTTLPAVGSNEGFVAKYNSAGTVQWAIYFAGTGNDLATAITTDGTNVYVAGTFVTSMSVNGASTVTSGGGQDAFIMKLNAATGAMVWATPIGGNASENIQGICLDPSGNIYASGNFASTSANDFGSFTKSPNGTGSDLFVLKMDSSGTITWVSTGGVASANDNPIGSSVCYVPALSEVVVVGGANGGGTATYGSVSLSGNAGNDIVLLEVNASTGAFVSGKEVAGSLNEDALAAAYDASTGDVFLAGYFGSPSLTFGSTTINNSGTSTDEMFYARYNASTDAFTWAKSAGGSGTGSDRIRGMCTDGFGGIYLGGIMSVGTASFPTASTPLTLSNGRTGGGDPFIVKVDGASGNAVWATQGTADNTTIVDNAFNGIAYSGGAIWATGQYSSNLTFSPLTALASVSGSTQDILVAKLTAPPPLTATQSQVNLTCNGVCTGSATVVASGGTAPYTYSWSPSGGSGATASSLCATNYTVTITDAASSSITKTFTITQPPAIVITPISQTNVGCFNGSNGAAQVTTSGGTGTLTYNWTPGNPTGDGTGSISGLTAQVYTITITDANSCTATRTFTITQPPALSVTPVSQTNVACFGGSTGAASVTASGGTPGYTYDWTPGNPAGDGTASVTGLSAGNWTCMVTDANGCTGTRTFTITSPASAVSGTTVVTNVACFGGNTGAINLTPTGGTGPYTENWLPSGPTTEDRTNLTAGTYTVQITDVNGCTGTVNATVTQPTSPVSGTTVVTNVACFGGNTGAINLTPTGGTGPYTENWLPSGPTTEDRTNLTAGTYTVQITDANGCTGTVNATVTQPTSPVSGTTVVTNVACFGGNTGAINLTPTGGTGPYTENWLPSGPTTEDRTNLTAGTYTVQITDANGCTGTVNATVTQPTSPVSGTTVVTNVACFGGNTGAINLTPTGGTGPYTENWLPSGPTTEDRTNLTAGTYTVQITDVNGCTGTVNATVTQPTAPVSGTTVVTNVACFGGNTGAINLTPTGGTGPYTENWLPSGPTTEDRTNLTAGTYTVQITDVNGCTGTVNATVTQPTSPVSGTTVVTNVSCFGGSNGAINLTPTGGTGPYTENWLPSGPTTEDRTGLTAGTYTVQITDVNGCTGTVNATVTQPTAPVSGTTVVTNVSCFGGSNGAINLTPAGGTPGYTFNWTGGVTTEDRTGLTAGTYTVTITDANGCTGTVTATITAPSTAVSGTTVVTNVSCFGGNTGAINLTPTGGTPGYTFNWLPSGPTTEDRTNLTAGTYTVQITDANGCTGTVNATVTQPTTPVSGTTVVTNVSCFGGSNGAINLTPTGGTGPYTENWLPSGPTTEDRTGLTAGTYTVQITDANGCTGTVNATVTQPSAPVSGTTVVTNVSCFGGANGAINLTPTGGTPGYTFNWTGGVTTEDRSGLSAGTYTVTITDANGCTGTVTATITAPSTPVSGTTVVTNVSCFGGSNGAINLTPAGGTPGYTFNWGGGITTEDRSGLSAGTYSVTITDANGCTGTATATITAPSTAVSGTTVVTNVSCAGGSNGAINLTPAGGTPGYTFNWGGGITTEDRSGLSAGTYSVTITDANGCTGTLSTTVTEPTPLVLTINSTSVSCNGACDGTANITVTGGTPGYTYMWAPVGQTTPSLTGLCAGTYTCSVTDANGCTAVQSVTITQPAPLSATATATSIMCNGGSATVTVSATGGTTAYTGTGTFTAAAGTHNYTVTDAHGCSAVASVTITEPAAITGSQNVTLCAGQSLTVGSSTYNTTGVYTDVLTSANGCDSTLTTNLTILDPITGSQSVTLCAGQSLTVGSNTYTTTGVYTDVLTAANSCDSTLTTNLTVLDPVTATQTLTVCAGQSVTVGSNMYDTTGTYTDVLVSANGCDSTVTTNLTVLPVSSGSQTVTLCAGQSLTVGSSVYTASGTYSDTLVSANGCDSTVTTNLTVLPANTTTNTYTLCAGGSVTVGSNTYTATGIYTDVFTAANGCDSTVVTDLTITTVDVSVTQADPTVTANQGGAAYQWYACNETGITPIAGETSQSFTASMNGSYAVTVTYNGCTDTSDCVMIIAEGIAAQTALNNMNVYPNPANDMITIEVKNSKAGDENTIMLYDAVGKLVYAVNTTAEKTTVDLSKFAKGIYVIRMQNANGVVTRRITKQ